MKVYVFGCEPCNQTWTVPVEETSSDGPRDWCKKCDGPLSIETVDVPGVTYDP